MEHYRKLFALFLVIYDIFLILVGTAGCTGVFGDIRTLMNGVSKSDQIADLQLTRDGKFLTITLASHAACKFAGCADLRDMPPSILIHHMRHQIDGSLAFRLDFVEGNATGATHRELREAPQGVSRAAEKLRRDDVRPVCSCFPCRPILTWLMA
jgi:hypothetical protein